MKWADYCVSKLSLNSDGFIDRITVREDLGEKLSSAEFEQNRTWMVQKVLSGKTFCSIKRNEHGSWNNIGGFSYDGNIFRWYVIPQNAVKRKTFISYYHFEDQFYKERFKNLFDDLIIHKSVEDGDIDSDNSDAYIKQLIQKDYLTDVTVLVVLIGQNTRHRKHIDWEISGALNYKVGNKYSGLLGLLLPDHPDFGTSKATYSLMPARLADNFRSKYAVIQNWTDDRIEMQKYIELAFERRNNWEMINNSRIQMTTDTNE